MRWITIGLLFLSCQLSAQVTGRYPFTVSPSSTDPDTLAGQDNFTTRSIATLNAQGLWAVSYGGVSVDAAPDGDKRIYPGNASANSVAYMDVVLDSDHACEITVDSAQGGRGLGPAVRIDGDDCIAVYSTPIASYFVKIIDGAESELYVGDPWSEDDVVQLWAHGTNAYVFVNGSLDTSIDSDGIVDITSHDTGGVRAGVAGYGSAGWGLIDNVKIWNSSW